MSNNNPKLYEQSAGKSTYIDSKKEYVLGKFGRVKINNPDETKCKKYRNIIGYSINLLLEINSTQHYEHIEQQKR